MWTGEKRLKNTTGATLTHSRSGLRFKPGVYIDVTPDFLYFYRNNYDGGQMWGWFNDGSIIFNDGTQDYTNAYEGYHRFVESAFGIPFLSETNSDRTNKLNSITTQEAIEEVKNKLDKEPDKIVWVSKNGSDTTGTGEFHNPYLTIKKAATSITDSSTDNRYAIRVAPGVYSEDNPIAVPGFTTIDGVGRGIVKVVAQNDAVIFTASHLSRYQNLFIIGNGTSNEVGIYLNVGNAQIQIWDVVFIDTYIGLQVDNANDWINANNLEFLTTDKTIEYGVRVTAGKAQINGIATATQNEPTMTYGVCVNGATSICRLQDIVLVSSNITTAVCAQNSGDIHCSINIDGATIGVFGDGGVIRCTEGIIKNTETAIKIDNAGLANISSTACYDNTADLEVVDLNSQIHIMSGFINRDKISFPNGYTKDILLFQDEKEGDLGIAISGELAVGRPERGAETVIGEGDSYTRGMLVYTTDNTATSTTDGGNLVDVSTIASNVDGNTFSFQGSTANHCIYIASDLNNGSDYLRHFGIKTSQTLRAIEATKRSFQLEYWDGSNWIKDRVVCTHANLFYRYANTMFIRQGIGEHIRFGAGNSRLSVKKTFAGKERYWSRIRITHDLTQAPVFDQFKLSCSRTEINADGTITYHGRARLVDSIAFAANTFGETGGVTNSNFDVGTGGIPTGWTHSTKNNRLNGNGDAVYAIGEFPKGICTSCPLGFRIVYLPLKSGPTADATLKLSFLPVQVANILVADETGGIDPIVRTLANTQQLTAVAAQTITETIAVSDISRVQSAQVTNFYAEESYEDDLFLLRIELDDDGDGQDIAILGVSFSARQWTLGGI